MFETILAITLVSAFFVPMLSKRSAEEQSAEFKKLEQLQSTLDRAEKQLAGLSENAGVKAARAAVDKDPNAILTMEAGAKKAYDAYMDAEQRYNTALVNYQQYRQSLAPVVITSDKSGLLQARRDLKWFQDAWQDDKKQKTRIDLKKQNEMLNSAFHAQQDIQQAVEKERAATTPEEAEAAREETDAKFAAGEALLEGYNKKLRSALRFGWEAVNQLEVPDCCEDEAEFKELAKAKKLVDAQREQTRKRAAHTASFGVKGRSAGFGLLQGFAPARQPAFAGHNTYQGGFPGGFQGAVQGQGGLGPGAGSSHGGRGGGPRPSDTCFLCGKSGHWAKSCPNGKG